LGPARQGRQVTRPAALAAAVLAALLAGCGDGGRGGAGSRPAAAASPGGAPGFRFVDVAREAGLTRVTFAGRPSKDHLLDSGGGGCAWLDFDRDGRLDAFVANAWRIEGRDVAERGKHALYRNRGDGTFEDVTDRARIGGDGRWGTGVSVADYDRDGWADVFVASFGANALYRNRGDGTFEDVAAKAGVSSPGWNTGACFFDADGDGWLDLYVAAYISCTAEDVLCAKRTAQWKGVAQVAFGPFGLRGAADHFFRADGKGGFADATAEAGLEDRALAFGFAVRAADFDEDGDLDLFVANDSDPNYLYRNDGKGRFEEVGLWSGCARDRNGAAQAGMGVTVGDANEDGHADILLTTFAEDFSTLYLATAPGFFEDGSAATGIGPPTYLPMKWGASLSDLDCDGDLDAAIANGHIYPQVDAFPDRGQTYAQAMTLLENLGKGRFEDASARAGPGFAVRRSARGLAAGDYDDDGDVDFLVTALDEPPVLLRNDSRKGHWLTVACEVPARGTPLPGTRVEVRARGRTFSRDVTSSDSFLSCPDPRLHFGLGEAAVAERVTVFWRDGSTTVLENVPADRILAVRKGG
jgi:enediyne biosynthesis protein E4